MQLTTLRRMADEATFLLTLHRIPNPLSRMTDAATIFLLLMLLLHTTALLSETARAKLIHLYIQH